MPAVKMHCWIPEANWSVFYNDLHFWRPGDSAFVFIPVKCIQYEAEIHLGAICIRWSVTVKKTVILSQVVVFLVFDVVLLSTFFVYVDAGVRLIAELSSCGTNDRQQSDVFTHTLLSNTVCLHENQKKHWMHFLNPGTQLFNHYGFPVFCFL